MEIGKTGNLQPYIDFHGTDTDGEYSSRIWRKDNGTFEITQAGDNPLALTTYGTSDGTLRGANIELYSKSNEAHPGYAYYDADRHIFRNADGNSPFMVLDLDTSAEISNDHGEFKFYPWEYRVENDDASTYIGNYNGESTARGFSAIINNKTGTDRGGLFIGVTDDNGDESAIMCFNQILEDDLKTNGHSGEIFSVRTNGNVTAAGNLLVGTTATNPASSYDSSNPDGVSLLGNKIEVSRSGGGAPFDVNRGEDGSVAVMRHKGIIVGNIAVTSSSMSFNNTSDYRLKEDIVEMKGSLDRLKALKPCNFKWKSNGTRVDGFIAHEAQYVVPEAVTGTKDAVDAEGKPEYQGIDQAKLVPLLTKALQEAVAKIEALEARVTALEYK
jgi:hypothetical protein